jgi:spermidine export protein MdtI
MIGIPASFTALSQAVKGIGASISQSPALWGGTGILLTAVAGLRLFKQHLSRLGWLG